MEKLLNCPFCGGEAVLSRPNMHGLTTAFCKRCGVETPWGKPDEAATTWNRRTEEAKS